MTNLDFKKISMSGLGLEKPNSVYPIFTPIPKYIIFKGVDYGKNNGYPIS